MKKLFVLAASAALLSLSACNKTGSNSAMTKESGTNSPGAAMSTNAPAHTNSTAMSSLHSKQTLMTDSKTGTQASTTK